MPREKYQMPTISLRYETMKEEANILMITIDCLRFDRSIQMMKYISKSMEKMGFKVSLIKAISPSTYTWPSFASIFSSMYPYYPSSKATLRNRFSFVELLRRENYITLGFPNNFVLDPLNGFSKGFIYYHYDPKISLAMKTNTLFDLARVLRTEWAFLAILNASLEAIGSTTSYFASVDSMLNMSYKLLTRKIKPNKRWFLWVHLMDLHVPYTNIVKHNSLQRIIVSHILFKYYITQRLSKKDYSLVKHLLKIYDESITKIATLIVDYIYRIVEKLKTKDLYVFIFSDHGEEFLEHGALGHLGTIWIDKAIPHLYNELLLVPLLIAGPNEEIKDISSLSEKNIISTIDVAPTILSLTHYPYFKMYNYILGRSLLRDLDFIEKRNLMIAEVSAVKIREHEYGVAYAIVDRRYKYIYNPILRYEELYDLYKDPHERNNIALDNPDIVKDFRHVAEKYKKDKVKQWLLYRVKVL